jgi:hypothetical protein
MVIRVEAFDWNCSQYMAPRFSSDEVRSLVEPLKQRIKELESMIAKQNEIGESLNGIHSPICLAEIWIRWRFREL